MPAEFAAKLYSKTLVARGNGSGGAGVDAQAALQAQVIINFTGCIGVVDGNRIFFADFNTCFTFAAGLIRKCRGAGPDDSNIFDLGL